MSSPPDITHFTAQNNAVIGIEDAGLVAQGYANEPLHLVCLCYGVPGLGERGEDVAKVIANLLNEKGQVDEQRASCRGSTEGD